MIKKLSSILLLAAGFSFGQGLVTVTANPAIARADGSLVTGTAFISWQNFTTATGVTVSAGTKNVGIASGVFTSPVQLYPNVGATPGGTSYRVTYQLSGGPNYVRNWYIPATSSVTVQAIEFPPAGLVGQTAIVSPAQLTQAGATPNQALCWNGAFWAPGSCGGGGGGGTPAGATGSLQYNNAGSFGAVPLGTTSTVYHGNASGLGSFGQIVNNDIANGTIDLTSKVTGILPQANGGTGGTSSFTNGSVIFAGASGAFTQNNTKLFWDNGVGTLMVGTNAPGPNANPAFVVQGNMETHVGIGQQAAWFYQQNNLNRFSFFAETDGNTFKLGRYDSSSPGMFIDAPMSISRQTGNIGFGTGAGTLNDTGFKVQIQNSGVNGTLQVWDQTSSTGTTGLYIRAGAGQSMKNLLAIQDNTGTLQTFIDSSFQVNSPKFISTVGSGANLTNLLSLASNAGVSWSSTFASSGTADTGIYRSAVRTVEVNNGTAGQRYGTSLSVGSELVYDNTPSTGVSNLTVQLGAGQGTNLPFIINDNGGSRLFGVDQNGFGVSFGWGIQSSGNRVLLSNPGVTLANDAVTRWTSTDYSGSVDTGLSRISANLIGVGNGTAGNFSGGLKMTGLTLAGITGSTQCLHVSTVGLVSGTGSDCGSGTSGANAALSNLASVSVNTSLLFQTGVDLGSSAAPARDLFLCGGCSFGTNSFRFTGTPTGSRVLTIPDVTANLATSTGTLVNGNAVQVDASGRLIDWGAPPTQGVYQGSCTGTATSNATLLIFLNPPGPCTGTSAATANALAVIATRTGIIRNLRVHADVAGVNGSSGVVTVQISGSGATSVTCTIGTSNTCSDTTHTAAVSAGALLDVFVSTQLGETLGGLNISFEY